MTGVPFLDDMMTSFIPAAGIWFLFEIGISWFRGALRAATDQEVEL